MGDCIEEPYDASIQIQMNNENLPSISEDILTHLGTLNVPENRESTVDF